MSINLSTYLTIYRLIFSSTCLSFYLSIFLSVSLSIYTFIYLSIKIYLAIMYCIFMQLSIYLRHISIYLSFCLSLPLLFILKSISSSLPLADRFIHLLNQHLDVICQHYRFPTITHTNRENIEVYFFLSSSSRSFHPLAESTS